MGERELHAPVHVRRRSWLQIGNIQIGWRPSGPSFPATCHADWNSPFLYKKYVVRLSLTSMHKVCLYNIVLCAVTSSSHCLCVCMYIVYVCVCVCMCMYVYVCVCMCMYVSMCLGFSSRLAVIHGGKRPQNKDWPTSAWERGESLAYIVHVAYYAFLRIYTFSSCWVHVCLSMKAFHVLPLVYYLQTKLHVRRYSRTHSNIWVNFLSLSGYRLEIRQRIWEQSLKLRSKLAQVSSYYYH